MTNTKYRSQTSLWVMPWLVFSELKKPHPYINLVRSTTTVCGHVLDINTMWKRKETTCGCIFFPFCCKFRVSLQKRV